MNVLGKCSPRPGPARRRANYWLPTSGGDHPGPTFGPRLFCYSALTFIDFASQKSNHDLARRRSNRARFLLQELEDRINSVMSAKEWTETVKNGLEAAGLLLVGIYFVYRLLLGSFISCRLAAELACDTPFKNRRLVKCTLKLKNTGPASLRVKEAWLWVIKVDPQPSPQCQEGAWPNWPKSPKSSKSLPTAPPLPTGCVTYLGTDRLDLTRLTLVKKRQKLGKHQAKEEGIEWLNLEVAGELQRQFLFELPPGCYKVEFRLLGEPLFSGRYLRFITSPLYSATRVSQWVATAVIAVEEVELVGLTPVSRTIPLALLVQVSLV